MADNKSELGLWEEVMSTVPDDTITLGSYFAHQLLYNPRHILFTFSRYKFAARLLGETKKRRVLELGCNEGLGTLLLAQTAKEVVGIDFDKRAIRWAQDNLRRNNLTFVNDDFLGKNFGRFDAVVSLDVIEHIPCEKEDEFLSTIYDNLNDNGFCIIGTPNISASKYASEASRLGHVNLHDQQRFKELFLKKFRNVFVFNCNDEMVHTGHDKMSHYFIALCVK